MKNQGTLRDPKTSVIMALPVRECHLIFSWDTLSGALRVKFKINKGSFNSTVGILEDEECKIKQFRDKLIGRWMTDFIDSDDQVTYLVIVAVSV